MSTAVAAPGPAGRERAQTGRRHGAKALTTGLFLLAVALLAAVALSLAVGSGDVPLRDVVHGVFDPDRSVRGQLVVQEVRIPRTLAGLLAGAALGLAGTVMQGVTRNPLADPGLLGINAGAAVTVVFAMSVLSLTEPEQYIWFGFLGACLAAGLVYGVASLGREGATPVKLALAGAAATALLISLTDTMLLTDGRTYDQYRFWQVGALDGRDLDVLLQALPFIVAGGVLALCMGPRLNGLALGDDLARGLGQRVSVARLLGAGGVVLLCGAATAIAGPIGFVGLAVPHAVRMFTGPDYRWILPYSAVLAPTFLLAADVLGRVVAPPGEVQVGVVTAAVGCVPFILLVRRRGQVEL
ncbi:FecCD family ABC transporter permease [Streptomyces minutiscleroticus]|uniref:Iron ABC transporter permease n=1 Tax=Streptomyces minutiscleroticus TaxID=68238 RepID=A0A918U4J0_9ACTN|nr:iron ABC transporter permease [Streptomyces minutiscleroticus]GGX90763.1 iron ABC transporter permease [Streptomyces minutiscleroticus]